MKGLLLAGLASALLMLGTVIGLRFYHGGREFKVFIAAFAGAVGLYAGASWLLPPALGFIPASWQETSPVVDFGNGLLVLALVFHGFWTFCYFACVSPSMTVLVKLQLRGRDGMSADEAFAMQGSEEPVNLIFQRRLPKLIRGGYVGDEAGAYRLR